MPADIIIYAIIAAGLAIWLRNLLGTNPEDEQSRPPTSMKPQNKDKNKPKSSEVIHLDLKRNSEDHQKSPEDKIAALAQSRTGAFAIDNKTAENKLLEIVKADKNFDVKQFLENAQDAFAFVVEAFADGDRDMLGDMLDAPVYKAFDDAITARENRGERAVSDVHAINKSHIIEADIKDKRIARITVRFEAKESSATYNKEDVIIIGNPDRTIDMIDIWTFSRDLKSRDPRWLVVETRGDFDDDNDTLPNAGK